MPKLHVRLADADNALHQLRRCREHTQFRPDLRVHFLGHVEVRLVHDPGIGFPEKHGKNRARCLLNHTDRAKKARSGVEVSVMERRIKPDLAQVGPGVGVNDRSPATKRFEG